MNSEEVSLKQLIRHYILYTCKENHGVTNSKELELVCQLAEEQLYQRTRSEIIKDLTETEIKQINKQVKQEASRLKAKSVSHLLIESGFLALLIGLFVNQLTNGINILIPTKNQAPWTAILCAIIFVLIILVYACLVLSSIAKLLNLGDTNDSNKS